jgi:selenocysteine lyase/cysteine desulfurase
MLKSQKYLFNLDSGVHYLNNAYRGPQLKSSEEAGISSIIKQRNPFQLKQSDFFEGVASVRTTFGKLVNCDSSEVAIIPSTSYGFTSVLNNIKPKVGGKAIVVQDEFPSGYFSITRWAQENQASITTISPDPNSDSKGESWNTHLIDAIDANTSVVLISSVHWMSGLKFDLEAIGDKCQQMGAAFIVDGTQSVGAMPIDVKACKIDALICAAYKWLLGHYSIAMAYIGERFNNGIPLEESWMNRENAQDFSRLSEYASEYKAGASRYTVGEAANFILMPMLQASLNQILEWTPEAIQNYAGSLNRPLLDFINQIGGRTEPEAFLAQHLFAPQLPKSINSALLKKELEENQIFVSSRGEYLRVSINVFNDTKDIEALMHVIGQQL